MANKVVLVDDLDGKPADETFRFAIDGVDYLIDLSTTNANQLRDILKPYIQAGRRAVPPPKERKRGSRPQNIELDMIRYWANERGYTVAPHGRIPKAVEEAYRHAHP
jgi:hypothetical protein